MEPRPSVTLFILPVDEAEVIDDILDDYLNSDSNSESLKQFFEELMAYVLEGPQRVWHLLNTLGDKLKESPPDAKFLVKCLLVVHKLISSCTSFMRAQVCDMLLSTVAGSPSLSLDLLLGRVSADSGFKFGLSYCSFLEQRVTCAAAFSDHTACTDQRDGSTGEEGTYNTLTLELEHWKKLGSLELLDCIQGLQELQERLLHCSSEFSTSQLASSSSCAKEGTGNPQTRPSCISVLLSVSLESLLSDSFMIYSTINFGMMELVDRFDALDRPQALSSMSVFKRSALHAHSLASLYDNLGTMCLGLQGVSFPSVATMGEDWLTLMQQMVQEVKEERGASAGSPEASHSSPSELKEFLKRGQLPGQMVLYDSTRGLGLKDTPPPEQKPSPPPLPPPPPPPLTSQQEAHQFDATARSLFGRSYRPELAMPARTLAIGGGAGWEATLDATLDATLARGSQSCSSAAVPPGWESALVQASPSALSTHPLFQPRYGGGWDSLLVESLYEAAQAQREVYAAARSGMSPAATGTMALPGDPFASSCAVPPPPLVQMALRAQQQMAMLLEQRMMLAWEQQQRQVIRMQRQQQQGPIPAIQQQRITKNDMQICYNWSGAGVHCGINAVVPFT